MKKFIYIFLIFLCLLLFGCGNEFASVNPSYSENVYSTQEGLTITKISSPMPSITPSPTLSATLPNTKIQNSRFIKIYSDQFYPDWGLFNSDDVNSNIAAKTFVRNGTSSISLTPLIGNRQMSIIVERDASSFYPRDIVLGFRFWINPANGYLKPSNLFVNIIGNDEYTYYKESIQNNNGFNHSETSLEQLGYTQLISPETWVEVVVLMDELSQVPDYEYMVGFYIKNHEEFLQTFYIDDVQLIIKEGETIPKFPTSTAIPTTTFTTTPSATSTPTQPETPYWTPTPSRTPKPEKPKDTATKTPEDTPTRAP